MGGLVVVVTRSESVDVVIELDQEVSIWLEMSRVEHGCWCLLAAWLGLDVLGGMW